MKHVDLAEIIGKPMWNMLPGADQIILPFQLFEKVFSIGSQIHSKAKLIPFCYIHVPKLSRPGVNISKDVGMDSLQMPHIQLSLNRLHLRRGQPKRSDFPFSGMQCLSILDVAC